ncbi:MAG: RNA 2',3'-cyclic phosphodiesterase [Carboxylicivirga sp.]|nr:RNA 2',3'-cyclic phosphodiesterase [Carboxylicivirga sp.]
MTVKFLGEVNKSDLDSIIERLSQIKSPQFEIKPGDLGVFKNYKQVVVWQGIQHSEELNALQAKVESALIGDQSGDKLFTPHITLLRLKKGSGIVRDNLKAVMKKEMPALSLNVNAFTLYESQLGPNGPKYIEKATFPLTGIWRDD